MRTLHAELAAQRTTWLHDTGHDQRQHTYLAYLARWQRRQRRAAAHERVAREHLTYEAPAAAQMLHRPA